MIIIKYYKIGIEMRKSMKKIKIKLKNKRMIHLKMQPGNNIVIFFICIALLFLLMRGAYCHHLLLNCFFPMDCILTGSACRIRKQEMEVENFFYLQMSIKYIQNIFV